jgi:nucleotide-binding universal stress UspA family protein
VLRRIIVPLDGTRFGDHALPAAIDIALRTGAAIEIVHVHRYAERDPRAEALPQYRYQHVAEADEEYERNAMREEAAALEAKAADLEMRYGVSITARILTGRTESAILEEAGNIVADLVVLASHARSGLDRVRHGSLAHSLVAALNVPALCIHPAEGDTRLATRAIRRILVTLDGSRFSEQILDPLAPLANALRAELTFLHVVTPRPHFASGLDDTAETILTRDQALWYLHDVAERWRGRIPEPLLLALEDRRPANLIATVLVTGQYDAVAMATHGRGGITSLLVGSVASDVLHATHVPVFMYRPRLERLPAAGLTDSLSTTGE